VLKEAKKIIVAPIDGSEYSEYALKYLSNLYSPHNNVTIILCYILPTLPPMFYEPELRRQLSQKLKFIEENNVQMAQKILNEGRKIFIDKGFGFDQICIEYREKKNGIALDIIRFSEMRKAEFINILWC
jgi:hypothetical protein